MGNPSSNITMIPLGGSSNASRRNSHHDPAAARLSADELARCPKLMMRVMAEEENAMAEATLAPIPLSDVSPIASWTVSDPAAIRFEDEMRRLHQDKEQSEKFMRLQRKIDLKRK